MVNITDSTISGNTGDWGGGITNDRGTMTITNSTISGNDGGEGGGGIGTELGTLTITNSTVVGKHSRAVESSMAAH